MKLILRVSSSNQYCDGGCEFTSIDLTRELANIALRRIKVLKDHKKVDESIYGTYYWDFPAKYFSPQADFRVMPGNVKNAILVVGEDGIAFLAIPKHYDFYVTTAEISVPLLESAAKVDETEACLKPAS